MFCSRWFRIQIQIHMAPNVWRATEKDQPHVKGGFVEPSGNSRSPGDPLCEVEIQSIAPHSVPSERWRAPLWRSYCFRNREMGRKGTKTRCCYVAGTLLPPTWPPIFSHWVLTATFLGCYCICPHSTGDETVAHR